MKRHYYISDDLDDLELIEQQLEGAGVTTPEIRVLSEDDDGIRAHHLGEVEAVLRRDVVHGTKRGAVVGVLAAALVLFVAWITGITETTTWVPPIFLSVIILGFCIWEGGLIGMQVPHTDFVRFKESLDNGKHVLAVDVSPNQEQILQKVTGEHPKLVPAGEGDGAPGWLLSARLRFDHMIQGTAWRHQ